MRLRFPLAFVSSVLLANAVAIAQEVGEQPQQNPLVVAFLSWLPFLIVLALVFIFFRAFRPKRYRQVVDVTLEYSKRAMIHMDRVEEKLDRLLEALAKK